MARSAGENAVALFRDFAWKVASENKQKFRHNGACYGKVAAYNTHPLVAGSPAQPVL